MKRLSIALMLSTFCILFACTEQAQVTEALQNDCPKYVELNQLSNYDNLKADPANVVAVNIEGDCIVLTLQYGGGCKEHKVDLALILPSLSTPPNFEVRHDAKDDVCKALITKDYRFDISGIREQGKASVDFILSFKNSSGEITSQSYTYNY